MNDETTTVEEPAPPPPEPAPPPPPVGAGEQRMSSTEICDISAEDYWRLKLTS